MANDYSKPHKARKKLGTPKTSMWIEPAAPEEPKPKPPAPKPGSQEFLNMPNTYDKNTYTPDMFPVKKTPILTKT